MEKSYDSIRITGTPEFTSTIPGGINGDIATSAIMVNAIRAVQKAEAGLKTMLDIPAQTCCQPVEKGERFGIGMKHQKGKILMSLPKQVRLAIIMH
ncbi:hypothetical protein [Fodinibius salicampi]|uniref:hypothetical protein n=1 Tax=Fodinibius salicampi TaxID=1920655 RepID=UPI003CD0B070